MRGCTHKLLSSSLTVPLKIRHSLSLLPDQLSSRVLCSRNDHYNRKSLAVKKRKK